MASVAGDMGHNNSKMKSDNSDVMMGEGSLKGEIVFPTALVELPDTEFKQIVARHKGALPEGYAVVNGTPFVYGESAQNRPDFVPRKGARRYTSEYYGALVAIGCGILFDGPRDIKFFGSYPSELVDYRDDLLRCVIGEWDVQNAYGDAKYCIQQVDAMDEPICGMYNVVLTRDGIHYQRSDIYGGTTLVIDIGGGTTDLQGVHPGGEPDYNVTRTITLGVNRVKGQFRKSFITNNKEDFASIDSLSEDKVNKAIRTGVYRGAGRTYPCEAEVNMACHDLVKNLNDVYENEMGGATKWDHIVLTGGGGALLESRLRKVLKHDDIILAEETETMHLANVRGGYKLQKFYEAEGNDGQ